MFHLSITSEVGMFFFIKDTKTGRKKKRKAAIKLLSVSAPKRDGEGVLLSLSLSDEESAVSWYPHQVILRLTSAQVAVEPPVQTPKP